MTIEDFNQSCGISLDLNNRWIVLAHRIDWDFIEKNIKNCLHLKKAGQQLIAELREGIQSILLFKIED